MLYTILYPLKNHHVFNIMTSVSFWQFIIITDRFFYIRSIYIKYNIKNNYTTQLVPTCAPSGIEESNLAIKGMKLYPNPATTLLNYENSYGEKRNFVLTIYDGSGRMVLEKTITEKAGTVSLKQLEKGMYFVVARDGETLSRSEKLLISE